MPKEGNLTILRKLAGLSFKCLLLQLLGRLRQEEHLVPPKIPENDMVIILPPSIPISRNLSGKIRH